MTVIINNNTYPTGAGTGWSYDISKAAERLEQIVSSDSGNSITIKGAVADGGSAVAVILDNSITLANSGAKLLSIRNNSVEKVFFNKDGGLTLLGNQAFSGDGIKQITTSTLDANVSDTVAALTFKNTVALSGANLAFQIQNSAGASILELNTARNLKTGALTVWDGYVQLNVTPEIWNYAGDGYTSSSVAALTLRSGVAHTPGDLELDVKKSDGTSLFRVDNNGKAVTLGGVDVGGTTLALTGTSPNVITSSTSNGNTSSTVAAITLKPTVAIDAGNLVLNVTTSAGASVFKVDATGNTTVAAELTVSNPINASTLRYSGAPVTVKSTLPEGGVAKTSVIVDSPAYSTTGSKLLSVQNNTVEKLYVDKDGNLCPGSDNSITLGDASHRFLQGYISYIKDGTGGNRIGLPHGSNGSNNYLDNNSNDSSSIHSHSFGQIGNGPMESKGQGIARFDNLYRPMSYITASGAFRGGIEAIGGVSSAELSSPTIGTPVMLSTTGGSLLGNTTYYYKVTAINPLGESLPSGESSILTTAGTDTNRVYVVFSSVVGAVGYKIYRGTSSGAEAYVATLAEPAGWTSYHSNTEWRYPDTGVAASGALPTVNTTGGIAMTGAFPAVILSGATDANTSTTVAALTIKNSQPIDNYDLALSLNRSDDSYIIKINNDGTIRQRANAYIVNAGTLTINTVVTSSPTAVGTTFQTAQVMTHTGSKLVNFYNESAEKAFIDKDGGLTISGVASGSTAITIPHGSKLQIGSNSTGAYFQQSGINTYLQADGGNLIVAGGGFIVATNGNTSRFNGNISNSGSSDQSLVLNSEKTDGASSVGLAIGPSLLYTTPGAKLVTFRNNNVEKSSVDKDGFWNGGVNAVGGLTTSTLPSPVNDTHTTATTGGTLVPGTYWYRVSATNGLGETLASTETSIVVPAGTNTNTVTVKWLYVKGATGYKVYGRTTGAQTLLATVTDSSTLTALDTNQSLTTALPTVNTTGGLLFTGDYPCTIVTSGSDANVDGTLAGLTIRNAQALQPGDTVFRIQKQNGTSLMYVDNSGTIYGGALSVSQIYTPDIVTAATSMSIHPYGVEGGVAKTAVVIDTPGYSVAGSKILSIRNSTVEKAYFTKDGVLGIPGATGDGTSAILLSAGAKIAAAGDRIYLSNTGADWTFLNYTLSTNNQGPILTTSAANKSVALHGNRTGGDTGADVIVNSLATRTAGTLLSVQNNTVEKASIDKDGYISAPNVWRPSYAELYENTEPGGTAITVTTAGTYYQWVSSTVGIEAGSGLAVGSATTDDITIGASGAGTYSVHASATYSATTNAVIHMAIHVGGTITKLISAEKVGNLGDRRHNSISGLLTLASTNAVDLRFTSDGNGDTVTVYHVNLTLTRIA